MAAKTYFSHTGDPEQSRRGPCLVHRAQVLAMQERPPLDDSRRWMPRNSPTCRLSGLACWESSPSHVALAK